MKVKGSIAKIEKSKPGDPVVFRVSSIIASLIIPDILKEKSKPGDPVVFCVYPDTALSILPDELREKYKLDISLIGDES
jgi:hypothetical protein